jgi:hypothetical protein
VVIAEEISRLHHEDADLDSPRPGLISLHEVVFSERDCGSMSGNRHIGTGIVTGRNTL